MLRLTFILEVSTLSLVSDLITRIRRPLNDIDVDEYTSTELTDYINQAHRLIYDVVALHRPMMIADPLVTGNTVAEQNQISLPKKPIKFIDVRVNKKPIDEIEITSIPDLTTQGVPTAYIPFGFDKIQLYPTPDKEYSYSVYYIPECSTLLENSTVPWPTNYEDAIVEFCVSRAGMRNGYNTNSEAQLTSMLHDKILELLIGLTPGNMAVKGYYR